MKEILTVEKLINILSGFNKDAYVYNNINGTLRGISLSDICWGTEECSEDTCDKKNCEQVIFDTNEPEK